jgi:hypothetical protein
LLFCHCIQILAVTDHSALTLPCIIIMDTLMGQVAELFQWVGRIAATVNLLVANAMSKQDGEALGQRLEASVDAKVDAMRQQFDSKLTIYKLECKTEFDSKIAAMRNELMAECKAECKNELDAKTATFNAKIATLDGKTATLHAKILTLDGKMAALCFEHKSTKKHILRTLSDIRGKLEADDDTVATDAAVASPSSLATNDDNQTLDLENLERPQNVFNLRGPDNKDPDPARVRWFLGAEFLESLQGKGPQGQWVTAKDARRVAQILSDASAIKGQKKNMGTNWNGHVQYICLCADVAFTKKPKQGGGKFFSFATNQMEEA